MGEDSRNASMKKVEHTIVDALPTYAEFIDILFQIIGGWTAEFVSLRFESFDLRTTFILHFRWELIQPLQQWNRPIIFPVEHYLNPRHCTALLLPTLRT